MTGHMPSESRAAQQAQKAADHTFGQRFQRCIRIVVPLLGEISKWRSVTLHER
jgi:hypothetical protein